MSGPRRLALLIVPLVLATVLLGFGLNRWLASGPPPTPLPDFQLGALADPDQQLGPTDFTGQIAILNVWASWCAPCRQEHPLLLSLSEAGTTIYGINFTDDREAALHWLNSLGDPYAFNVFDQDGQLAMQLGVYGVPETFLLDTRGQIHYKHLGLLDERIWEEQFLPRIQRLQAESGPPS